MFTTATATIPLTRPGPRAAMMATARRKYGKASSVSMERMMSWSTQRPMKPARSPQSEPTSAARAVAVSPTTREMRAPKRSRLRRSRPNSSVPSGCPAVRMGERRRAVSMTSGSRGAIHGASTASTAMTATSPRPKRAELLLRNMRTRSVIADARIEDGVEEIDHEVDEHEGRGDEEHAALDERVVARLDGPHHHGAEPRPGDGKAHAVDGHAHADAIEPRVLLDRRHDARGKTQKDRDQERARREHQGGLEAQEHLGEDGPAQRDGAAEIPLEDVTHPPHVLDDERLVEAQVAMEAHDVLLGRLGAEHDGGGIPRRQVQDGE